LRRHDRAIREAERTISLDPNLAIGHEVLASALTYSGRPAEALESFDRAMALDPYYPDLWLHLKALAMFQLGRYDEAIGLLKRRLIRNPNTDVSRELLAACYGHQGRNEEARAEWQEVFRVNPDYSLEYRRTVLPFKSPLDFEKIVDGLRKAGVIS
jgi:adenylate cyclase